MSPPKLFAQSTRARVEVARGVLAKLRESSKEALKLLAKIDKQHLTERNRLYELLGRQAAAVVDDLPEDADDAASEQAGMLEEQINDLAYEVEECSLIGTAAEELHFLFEAINEIYKKLKTAEAQLITMERAAAKLGL